MRISKRLLAATAILALAACGAEQSDAIVEEDAGSAEYTFDPESGEANMAITTAEGATAMQSGAGVEPDLPDGWSVYPEAEITDVINVSGTDGGVVVLTMSIMAPRDDIVAHYRKEAEATGFAIRQDITMELSRLINGERADGSTFSVSVVPGADGEPATAQLTLAQAKT